MKNQTQPFETREHDLTGSASMDFYDDTSVSLFDTVVPGLDTNRFEPVALKLYVSGSKPILTVYALDNEAPKSDSDSDETRVRKFKVPISWTKLFRFVKSLNLVVHNKKINMEDLIVDRK
ncbi:MAG: hypothetical protein BWY67_00034 [Bacteroidetes bacterium ADurb.Bin397]|jgi:hypothetical protein|nr:hypothetical protein [Bacteroidia bacterium]OQA12809.1 MAG: hypothetical protein BWY67_00034 [Bacteroidetes bacterium ADurb.Bin397]